MSSNTLLGRIGSYFISETRRADFLKAAKEHLTTNSPTARYSDLAGHPNQGWLRTVMFPEKFDCTGYNPPELLEVVIEPMSPADLERSSGLGTCTAPNDAQWATLETVKDILNRVLLDRLPVRFSTKREPSAPEVFESRQRVAEMFDCAQAERVRQMKADPLLPEGEAFEPRRRFLQEQFEKLDRFDEDASHLRKMQGQSVPLPVAYCDGFPISDGGQFCTSSQPVGREKTCVGTSIQLSSSLHQLQQVKAALHEIFHSQGALHPHDTQSVGGMNSDLAEIICEAGPGGGGSHMEYGTHCLAAGYDSAEILAPADHVAESDLCKLQIHMLRGTARADEIAQQCSEKMAESLTINYGSWIMAGVVSPGAGDVTKFFVTQTALRLVRHPTLRTWAPTVGSICGHLATLATLAAITGCGIIGVAGTAGSLVVNTGIFSKTVRVLGKTIGLGNVAVILIGTIRGSAWPLGVLIGGFLGKLAGTAASATLEKMLDYAAPLDEQGKRILDDARRADDGDCYAAFDMGDGKLARLRELDGKLAAYIESILSGKCFTSWLFKTDQDRIDKQDMAAGLDEALSEMLDAENDPPQAVAVANPQDGSTLRYRGGPRGDYRVGIV